MQETVLMTTPMDKVESYEKQWSQLKENSPGLTKILETIEKPEGMALVFSHDDPDGITSGLIFKRMLEKRGWKTDFRMPPGFLLSPVQLDEAVKANPGAKAVFILDKGTLDNYSEFGKKLPVYIVDHHPSPKAPTDCVYFNPALEKYTQCSTSVLAHGVSYLAGTRDAFDDFLALLGLKGDWAIEPVSGFLADFVKPFFVEFGKEFKNLFTLLKERPTMFDASQRENTCLLSRISEYVHGTGGGGFQYFYNDRDPMLKDVDHPRCIGLALEKLGDKIDAIKAVTSLDGFVALLDPSEKPALEKIWEFFLDDWEMAGNLLDSSTRAVTLGDTGIYLFVGGKVPLLPMIGSIKLFDLKDQGKDNLAQIIMVSAVSPDYTHISVRGTGDKVHSGKFCGEMQNFFHESYPELKGNVSGGGHPRAAECTVRTPAIPFLKVLESVTKRLWEMSEVDRKWKEGPAEALRMRAQELGLEYIS